MPLITLPDGSERRFDAPVSVHDVAADIGPGLAKAALAGVVEDQLVDTSHVIGDDSRLRIFTGRLIRETKVGDYTAVVPTISGQAWITGFAQYVLDPDDPFPQGYTMGDIWA